VKRVLVPLLVAVAAVAVLAAFVALAWRHHARPRLVFSPHELTLPADGAVHRAVEVRLAKGGSLDPGEVTTAGPAATVNPQGDDAVSVDIRSQVTPGTRFLTLQYRGAAISVPIHFVPDASDRFGDGTPDFLRLHSAEDRENFRAWFTTLADAAAGLSPVRLPDEVDDCAALLRWCYRNALHAHDVTWLSTMPLDTMPPLPSVAQYAYPFTPLSINLFRVRPGVYGLADNVNGSFAQFADAKTLLERNTFFVSRDVRAARPGDLLFYRQLEQNSPYHSMILTGPQHEWAVYDTGPIGAGLEEVRGQVRRVALDDLMHHPDARWRPLPENSNFLGVYRWNILREDVR